MLGDRGLADPELLMDHVTHHARRPLAIGQQLEDATADGVSQNVKREHRAIVSAKTYISRGAHIFVRARGSGP